MDKNGNKRIKIFWVFALIFLILALSGFVVMREPIAREICKRKWIPRELRYWVKGLLGQDWLVVFVHGTFGSTMSLLDLPTVNNDLVEGSRYKLLIDKMRNNPIFWRDQAVLGRGLIAVDPMQPLVTEEQMLSGAHVIVKSFLEIDKLSGQNRNLRAYTFGWSGLLSQQRRRREAIRFYNQLSQEIDRLEREEGIIDPKIEIIAHSHGGNLALNMAAIYHFLHEDLERFLSPASPAFNEFLIEMQRLKTYDDQTRQQDGQHRFDYWPTNKNLTIDRLVMMGTPVQPKTCGLAASEFFGQVLNIYSEEDGVQKMDYVSCCSDTESRKIALDPEICSNKVFQVRISVCSDQVLKGAKAKQEQESAKQLAWWQVLLGMKDISRTSWDPTHKELWFLVGDLAAEEPVALKPLPIAVYTPLIVSAVNKKAKTDFDLDVDLSVQAGKLLAFVAAHKTGDFVIANSVPHVLVRQLAQQAAPFISGEQDMEKIKNFIQQLMDEWKQLQTAG